MVGRCGKRATLAFGRYFDRLERRDRELRIVDRRCTIEASGDCDGTWVRSKNVEGLLKGLWSKAGPSYDRTYRWKPKEDGVRW